MGLGNDLNILMVNMTPTGRAAVAVVVLKTQSHKGGIYNSNIQYKQYCDTRSSYTGYENSILKEQR